MTAASSHGETREQGIIILGNAGGGKSYICNILIGHDQFEVAFRPEAVTTATEYHRISVGSNYMRIYNIPGLVEVNQDQIDRNKKEIMRAFTESPVSVVIFVWTQVGGRAQQDDIIAFKALNDAYKFPPKSLLFVVNNIPQKRPREYEGQFIATLSNMLKPMSVSVNDFIFLDSMEPEEIEKRKEARSGLYLLIDHHHACLQKKYGDIVLQSDQLEKMRGLLKKQRLEAEKDRKAFQMQIEKLVADYKIAKESADHQQQLMKQMEDNKKKDDNDRQRESAGKKKVFFATLGGVVDSVVGTVFDSNPVVTIGQRGFF